MTAPPAGPPQIAQATTVETRVVRGPEPIGAIAAVGLGIIHALGMSGRNGEIRIGMPTYNVDRYSGELGALQNWGTGPFVGRSPNVLGTLNGSSLPATTSSGLQTNSVLSAIVTNQGGS